VNGFPKLGWKIKFSDLTRCDDYFDKDGQNGKGTMVPTLPCEAEAILAKETSRVLASHVQTAERSGFACSTIQQKGQ
jgi:hypothetical protein